MEHQHNPTVLKEHKPIHGIPPNAPKRNYKLLVDPQLKKGQEKLVRFDGELYSCTVSFFEEKYIVM